MHRIPFHTVDRHLYRMESVLLWKNHLVTSFRLKDCVRVFLSMQTARVVPTDTKGVFHRSCLTSHCASFEKKRNFSHRSDLHVTEGLFIRYCRVILSSWAACLKVTGKERCIGAFVSRTTTYSIKSVLLMIECIRTRSWETWDCEVLFLPTHSRLTANVISKSLSRDGAKQRNCKSIHCKVCLNLLRTSGHSVCETTFVFGCVSVGKKCSWLQQYPCWRSKDRLSKKNFSKFWKMFHSKNKISPAPTRRRQL